jgi:hypothetical protein
MKNLITRIKYYFTTYDNPVSTDGIIIRCDVYADRHVEVETFDLDVSNAQHSDV